MTIECFIGPMFSGKCLIEGTPVIKSDGTVCPVEHIKKGDFLIDDCGIQTQVEQIANGMGNVVQVKIESLQTEDKFGSELDFQCNKDHIMTVWNTETKEICDVHVNDILKHKGNTFKMIQKPIMFQQTEEPLIDPYMMGYLYGSSKWSENGDLISRIPTNAVETFEHWLKSENMCFEKEKQKDETFTFAMKKHDNDPLKIQKIFKHTSEIIEKQTIIQPFNTRAQFLSGMIHRRRLFTRNQIKTKISGQDKIQLQSEQDFQRMKHMLNSLAIRYVFRKTGNPYIITLAQSLDQIIDSQGNFNLSFQLYKFHLEKTDSQKKYYGFRLSGNGRFALSTGIITHNSDSINSKLSRLTMFGGKKCVLISPLKDCRFQDDENMKKIKNLNEIETKVNDSNVKQFTFKNYTHNGKSFDCVKVKNLSDLEPEFINNHDIVGIDEIHFFKCEDLENFVQRWYFTKNIIVTLLNYYTNAKIPKQVQLLLPWCSEKTELYSYCDKCSGKATMTDIYNMTVEEQMENPVGGSEKYKAICRDCYIKKYKK